MIMPGRIHDLIIDRGGVITRWIMLLWIHLTNIGLLLIAVVVILD